MAELKQRMETTLCRENFEFEELEAVVSLVAGSGMIQRLDFGGFILLRPEVPSRYVAAGSQHFTAARANGRSVA